MKAIRADGTEVKRGDTIYDFRGDPVTFQSATRVREAGRSGKVMVNWDDDGDTFGREYYDNVFDLTVIA